jgi:hypothetical protein|tara:strand:- start:904 stop:1122 length:219 start_codon:yes stop_codon:yes gene_type:complete
MSLNTPKTFTLIIENIVKEKNITHMDAVLWYCEQEGLEPDGLGNLLSKGLKEKIEANARELNFLPKQAQLPV